MPAEFDRSALPATRATLERLAELDVRCVIPGHGEPFGDFHAAVERALRRTAAFEADPLRMASHALKVILVFSLLDRERMPLAQLPDFVAQVGIFSEFNARYFRLSATALAERLVTDLVKVGAVRRSDDFLVPA
ncbi:MAG TPA: MBL fold metallo-hydrolase, partial [Casimicrobiaceae bacterium]|nr:MBL fold metallo-hydrolase [Casimicrobiaceae bacterium]